MVIEYTGRHTVVTAKLKAQAKAGMERIDRVTNRCTSAHIILSEDKYRKIAEVSVQCRGESLVATCESAEMETALHDALNKVELQAIRHKERFMSVREVGNREAAAKAAASFFCVKLAVLGFLHGECGEEGREDGFDEGKEACGAYRGGAAGVGDSDRAVGGGEGFGAQDV
jgi:putative sigma-54 modulation protein